MPGAPDSLRPAPDCPRVDPIPCIRATPSVASSRPSGRQSSQADHRFAFREKGVLLPALRCRIGHDTKRDCLKAVSMQQQLSPLALGRHIVIKTAGRCCAKFYTERAAALSRTDDGNSSSAIARLEQRGKHPPAACHTRACCRPAPPSLRLASSRPAADCGARKAERVLPARPSLKRLSPNARTSPFTCPFLSTSGCGS